MALASPEQALKSCLTIQVSLVLHIILTSPSSPSHLFLMWWVKCNLASLHLKLSRLQYEMSGSKRWLRASSPHLGCPSPFLKTWYWFLLKWPIPREKQTRTSCAGYCGASGVCSWQAQQTGGTQQGRVAADMHGPCCGVLEESSTSIFALGPGCSPCLDEHYPQQGRLTEGGRQDKKVGSKHKSTFYFKV